MRYGLHNQPCRMWASDGTTQMSLDNISRTFLHLSWLNHKHTGQESIWNHLETHTCVGMPRYYRVDAIGSADQIEISRWQILVFLDCMSRLIAHARWFTVLTGHAKGIKEHQDMPSGYILSPDQQIQLRLPIASCSGLMHNWHQATTMTMINAINIGGGGGGGGEPIQ